MKQTPSYLKAVTSTSSMYVKVKVEKSPNFLDFFDDYVNQQKLNQLGLNDEVFNYISIINNTII